VLDKNAKITKKANFARERPKKAIRVDSFRKGILYVSKRPFSSFSTFFKNHSRTCNYKLCNKNANFIQFRISCCATKKYRNWDHYYFGFSENI